MDELQELEELFEDGFVDEEQYEKRRQDILSSLSFGSTVTQRQTSKDGKDACSECLVVYEEYKPPFCSNCGIKTKYFGKGNEDSSDELDMLPPVDSDSDDSLEPPPPPDGDDSSDSLSLDTQMGMTLNDQFDDDDDDEDDLFEQDMLDELLTDLASDSSFRSARSTASRSRTTQDRGTYAVAGNERFSGRTQESKRAAQTSSAAKRGTYSVKGTERFSGRAQEQRPSRTTQKQQDIRSRDTFAVKGNERFSGRRDESGRHVKEARKQKAKRVGAKPGVGGNDAGWAQLQAQMKAAQNAKKKKAAGPARPPVQQQQQKQLPRDTFAAPGNERFSERRKIEAKPKSRDTYAVKGTERFSDRRPSRNRKQAAQNRASREMNRRSSRELSRGTFTVDGQERSSNRQQGAQQSQLARGTFAVSGTERFSARYAESRPPANYHKKKKSPMVALEAAAAELKAPRDTTDESDDIDLEELERQLGDALVEDNGRVITMSDGPAPVTRTVKQVKKPQRKMPVEPATGGPALPGNLQWHQTPNATKIDKRRTYAALGEERFSERRQKLPAGKQTEVPEGACAFCQNGIEKGQKFKTALGLLWHRDCLKCGLCLKKLEKGMKFYKGELNSALCADCKKKRRKVCHLCKQPTARTELVNVMGKKIHVKCFRCNICDANLLAGYVQKRGQYLCIAHKDEEPVERDWSNPDSKGPNQTIKKQPIQYGPTEEDLERARFLKAKQEKKQREQQRQKEAQEAQRIQAALAESEALARQRMHQQRQQEERLRARQTVERYSTRDDELDEDLLSDLLNEPIDGSGYSGNYSAGDDNYDEEDFSAEAMLAEMDKPQWQRDAEREERGSMRSNIKKAQAELDAKDGNDIGYYSFDEDSEEYDGGY